MGKPPSANSILRNARQQVQKKNPIASDMFLPNHSGIASHPEAKKTFALIVHDHTHLSTTGKTTDDHHAQSHNMASHSDDDTYNINTSGTATIGGIIYADGNVGGLGLDVLRSVNISINLEVGQDATVDRNIIVGGTVDGVDIAAHAADNDAHHAETHTILSHDTDTTGAELTALADNSMADALHRHSELSASDGTPDRALVVDATGSVGIGTTAPGAKLGVKTTTNVYQIETRNSNNLRNFAVWNTDATGADVYVKDHTGTTKIQLSARAGNPSYFNQGNVGISDINPGSLLSLGNSISADKLRIFEDVSNNIPAGLGYDSGLVLFTTFGSHGIHFRTIGSGTADKMTIDPAGHVDTTKTRQTVIGGFCIKLTNKTGANSVAGELVETSVGTANAVQLASADGFSMGDWIQSSGTAGRGEGTAHVPNPTVHMQEIGHALEDAGANALGKVVLHFN